MCGGMQGCARRGADGGMQGCGLGRGFALLLRRGQDRRALRSKLPACLARAVSDSSCRQLFISRLPHLRAAPLHFASNLSGLRFFSKAIQWQSPTFQGPLTRLERISCPLHVWFSFGDGVQPHFF